MVFIIENKNREMLKIENHENKIVKMLKFENRIKSKMLEIKIVKIELNQKSWKSQHIKYRQNVLPMRGGTDAARHLGVVKAHQKLVGSGQCLQAALDDDLPV